MGSPFSRLVGGPLDSRNWRREAGWQGACAAIGREGLRPHDLRHTAATAWLRMTGDVKAAQALLGHATTTMTLDLCSRLLTDTPRRATDLMAERLAEAETEVERDEPEQFEDLDAEDNPDHYVHTGQSHTSEPGPEGEGS